MEFLPSNLRRHFAEKTQLKSRNDVTILSGLYLYALISQFVEFKDMFSVG